MVRGTFNTYRDRHALKLLEETAAQAQHPPLVQIEEPAHSLEETNV
jgi:hypothetical protein